MEKTLRIGLIVVVVALVLVLVFFFNSRASATGEEDGALATMADFFSLEWLILDDGVEITIDGSKRSDILRLDLIYPVKERVNVKKGEMFKVELDLTCLDEQVDCGEVLVNLAYYDPRQRDAEFVSNEKQAKPFYTPMHNPLTVENLKAGEKRMVHFIVDATGEPGMDYEFFAYANLVDDESVYDTPGSWMVRIVE